MKKATKKAAKKTAKKAATKKVAKKSAKKATVKKATKKAAPVKSSAKAASPKKAIASGATKNYSLTVGDPVPEFSVSSTGGATVSNSEINGHACVFYFYPRDNTPGCTLEGQDFRRLHTQFVTANCLVFGVSQDTMKSHDSFKAKCDFPFELLSDESGAMCKAFDVIQMKNNYGKTYEGIERSTFVIDKEGLVRGEWRKVSVEGHAQDVLEFVQSL